MRVAAPIAIALLAAACAPALEYVGPSAHPAPATVAALLRAPVDDQTVVFTGRLVQRLSDDHFLFSDGSAEIRVEVADDLLPGVRLSETSRVRIHGEVETRLLRDPEIEVERIEVVD